MRFIPVLFASFVCLSSSALAQEYSEYINREDGFRVTFPGQPTVSTTTFKSEYGADLPARVYSVVRGPDRYSITVVDYRDIQKIADERAKKTCPTSFGDERSCGLVNAGRGYWKEELGGALLHAMYNFIKRDAKVTHIAWAWQDLVEGIELQLTNNSDQSRTLRVHLDAQEPAIHCRGHRAGELSAARLVPAVDGLCRRRRTTRSLSVGILEPLWRVVEGLSGTTESDGSGRRPRRRTGSRAAGTWQIREAGLSIRPET